MYASDKNLVCGRSKFVVIFLLGYRLVLRSFERFIMICVDVM